MQQNELICENTQKTIDVMQGMVNRLYTSTNRNKDLKQVTINSIEDQMKHTVEHIEATSIASLFKTRLTENDREERKEANTFVPNK